MILRQAGTLGLKTCFLGGDGWGQDILRVAGAAAEGSFYMAPWHPDVPASSSRKLVEAFRRRFPEADYFSLMLPLTYDAFKLLADAMRRAGSLDHKTIRDALARTKNYPGVSGPLSFDANGDPVARTAAILKFDKNRILFHKTISYP
jgi:branched-chain amino acid transport system substrate-binding protein